MMVGVATTGVVCVPVAVEVEVDKILRLVKAGLLAVYVLLN